MASTITKEILSGSTNGRAILVAATGDPGTTIHTAVSGTSSLDEIWLYATNTSATTVALTIEWGSNTSPNDLITVSVTGQTGLALIIPGFLLNNSLVVKAYAGTTNVITIVGFVNNIT